MIKQTEVIFLTKCGIDSVMYLIRVRMYDT